MHKHRNTPLRLSGKVNLGPGSSLLIISVPPVHGPKSVSSSEIKIYSKCAKILNTLFHTLLT